MASFTYVPPFRGRAIRMIRRDIPFEELDIDFAEQEVRKTAETEKLNRVTRFALSGACRQREILQYFGETEAAACGHCDNCARGKPRKAAPGQAAAAPLSPDDPLLTTVRIVLSGVARTQARFACGKTLIAQMLCGSGSEKMKKLRLDRLTTFGMLARLRQPEAAALIDALIGVGCLEQTELDRFRPVVKLTDFGAEVMRGTRSLDAPLAIPADLLRKLRARRPDRPAAGRGPARTPSPPPTGDADPPEGWIESDSPGMGPFSYEEGESGAGATTNLRSAPGLSSSARNAAGQASSGTPQARSDSAENADLPAVASHTLELSPAQRPSHYWTWRLLAAGFAVEECAAIRGIEPEAALDHALRAVEEGWPLEARQCLPPELLAAMEAAVGPDEPELIRPLLAKLPPGTARGQVELFLRCRRRRQGDALRGGE